MNGFKYHCEEDEYFDEYLSEIMKYTKNRETILGLGIAIKDRDLKEITNIIKSTPNMNEQKLIQAIIDFRYKKNYINDDIEE